MQKFCFVDTETTGLNPAQHGVVQIACIVGHIERARFVEDGTLSKLIAPFPEDRIDTSALEVHGRTIDNIMSFDDPMKAHGELVSWLCLYCDKYDKKDKLIFAGYNARFDNDFVREFFRKAKDDYFGSWFWSPPMDVMSIAIDYLADQRWKMPNFKLSTVAQEMAVTVETSHEAMSDIRTAIEIWKKIRGLQ